jgi:hypothetical protein
MKQTKVFTVRVGNAQNETNEENVIKHPQIERFLNDQFRIVHLSNAVCTGQAHDVLYVTVVMEK